LLFQQQDAAIRIQSRGETCRMKQHQRQQRPRLRIRAYGMLQ
jgi:hypothetical protein